MPKPFEVFVGKETSHFIDNNSSQSTKSLYKEQKTIKDYVGLIGAPGHLNSNDTP